MNEFWIVEFHVFPVKDNYLLVLGGCHGNYIIMGVQNSSNLMLFLGFGVHMH